MKNRIKYQWLVNLHLSRVIGVEFPLNSYLVGGFNPPEKILLSRASGLSRVEMGSFKKCVKPQETTNQLQIIWTIKSHKKSHSNPNHLQYLQSNPIQNPTQIPIHHINQPFPFAHLTFHGVPPTSCGVQQDIHQVVVQKVHLAWKNTLRYICILWDLCVVYNRKLGYIRYIFISWYLKRIWMGLFMDIYGNWEWNWIGFNGTSSPKMRKDGNLPPKTCYL